jgi:hypothetical protein
MKNRISFLIFIAVLSIACFNTGCRKKKDTIVLITVRDASQHIVVGAAVKLFPKPSTAGGATNKLLWTKDAVTDYSGVATFDFNDEDQLGQSGVAVAHIDVVYGGSSGNGVIKVEEEKTSVATVYIN